MALPREHVEQVKFVQRVRHLLKDVLIFAVPNGAYVEPNQRVYLVKEGLLKGVPDLMVAEPIAPHHGLFIEMKTREGTISKEQKAVARRLRKKNYHCAVARSCDEAWLIINDYLNGEYQNAA